jgi:signal transduction histidine kinase
MFRKSIIRLTIGYLAGIMILSSIFSVVVYRASTQEFDQLQQRQQLIYRRGFPAMFLSPDDDPFMAERMAQVEQSRHNILVWLWEFNAIVFVVGGGVGYWLARYTIKPIQRSWESQARFTADASHELRTPLTTMRTENDVALRDPKLTLEEAKNILKSNVEEATKLTGLSNALLKLNQLQGRQLTLQPVTVTTVVAKAVERLARAATSRKMTITTHIDTQTIHADTDLLTEALVVLIDNAIKYGDQGSTININAAQHHQQMQIAIINRGAGIAEADQAKIFERFYRGDSSRTKTAVDGFGLGLSLAQDIVAAHRGHIAVESKSNETTTFTISLPVDPTSAWTSINPFRS